MDLINFISAAIRRWPACANYLRLVLRIKIDRPAETCVDSAAPKPSGVEATNAFHVHAAAILSLNKCGLVPGTSLRPGCSAAFRVHVIQRHRLISPLGFIAAIH